MTHEATDMVRSIDDENELSGVMLQKLIISTSMHVEQIDGSAATIYLRGSGARIRIPLKAYDLLLKFKTPQESASVIGVDDRKRSMIEGFWKRGFLVGEDAAAKLEPKAALISHPVRLFNCPAYKLNQSDSDIILVGVPYDFGDSAAAGARQGPRALREASLQLSYETDRFSGEPLGWFDADHICPILPGVTIGDCGDVLVEPGERQAELFARVSKALSEVIDANTMPVILGGDSVVSFPLIELMQARQPLSVIRIGRITPQISPYGSSFVSNATLPGQLLALPNISQFLQVGPCHQGVCQPGGLAMATPVTIRREGIKALEQHVVVEQAVHIGIDMNALLPPGELVDNHVGNCEFFTYEELRTLLIEIGERYRIVSLDLVGLNPSASCWGANSIAALYILLTGLSAALDRR